MPYINASPIDLGRARPGGGGERFIATQGPVRGRVGEGLALFWEMVWQEHAEVVVMLTRCEESGAVKCAQYFPAAVGEVRAWESWGSVACEAISERRGTEVRELRLRRKTRVANRAEGGGGGVVVEGARAGQETEDGGSEEVEERKVWHFLFTAWPDHEVPQTREDEEALLELIKMTRFRIDNENKATIESQSQSRSRPRSSTAASEQISKPRIVHCSAGVGRTGTFIALDHLLQELEEGKFDGVAEDEDPVFEAVKRLREQRMFMVYKPIQYAFIYQILRGRWQARMALREKKSAEEDGQEGSAVKKRKFFPKPGEEKGERRAGGH